MVILKPSRAAVDAPVLRVFLPIELLASRLSESFGVLRKQPSTRLPGRTRASSKSQSVKFYVEYQHIAQRLRLDIPTLCDPVIHDCLRESDLFISSFNAMD
ncbi:hypothetical protein BKA82DRAFT_21433 [Pisolithus tinctorius]|uniref:Uncharacterized protein n=1 Tax=Pisolithus tinctorius Marx 270 TaxID=870435 RepID=A0A0C3JMT2_PISTI|nr:hypothetical protein BKA82DRAFT_21433 [Pisolithus tinctorius]KIO10503.1 hypothetical protein M404DRAFT_21433 [Pisolithus tinctorius Marx 270]